MTCESGTLWITVDGQPQDVVLEAGEQFVDPVRGQVSVFALEAASVRAEGGRA